MKPNLDELERLAALATPRPWVDEGIGYIRSPKQRKTIAECMPPLCRGLKNIQQHGINAAYIVAACNSLPELINENRALQKRVRELEKQAVVLASHLSKHVLHTMSTKEWLEWSESVAKEAKC